MGKVAVCDQPQATKRMKELAKSFFLRNALMNKIKKEVENLRLELFQEMVDGGVDGFKLTVEVENPEGKVRIPLSADIRTPDESFQDIAILWDHLECATSKEGLDKFLRTVSATKKAVEAVCGRDVAVICANTKPGNRNVFVKPGSANP